MIRLRTTHGLYYWLYFSRDPVSSKFIVDERSGTGWTRKEFNLESAADKYYNRRIEELDERDEMIRTDN